MLGSSPSKQKLKMCQASGAAVQEGQVGALLPAGHFFRPPLMPAGRVPTPELHRHPRSWALTASGLSQSSWDSGLGLPPHSEPRRPWNL